MREARPIHHTMNISTATLLRVVGVIFILWILYLIRDILVILFLSLILAAAVDAPVDWLEKRKVPRVLGILSLYVLLCSVIALLFVLFVPMLTAQTQQFITTFPYYWNKFISGFEYLKVHYGLSIEVAETFRRFTVNIANQGGNGLFSLLSGLVGGIFSSLLILVITFYMVVEENAIKKTFHFLAPRTYQASLTKLLYRIQRRIGSWLWGQLLLSLIVGMLSYIGLTALEMPYAFVLSIIAAIAELIPYIGPILAAIPAIILAFTISPLLALSVIILYIVIQQLENNILLPKVMQKTVGLNPIISLAAVLIGAKLGGILGAFLALPVATALSVIMDDLADHGRAKSLWHGKDGTS